MLKFLRSQPPSRLIAFGFAFAILLGSLLLMLPCSVKDGVELNYIDSLYTSTSAVCVTGLLTVDIGDTFTPIGQFFVLIMMQFGGLGVAAIGVGIILAMRRKIDLKSRNLVREAMNLYSGKEIVILVKNIFLTTLIFELTGALLSFIVFAQDFPPLKAAWTALFHSVAAFNNSGFDILGNFQSLTLYRDNVLLNLVTCALIFFGGIGFLVIREVLSKKFRWKKLSMHSKVVLTMSALLILIGTLLLKLTEDVSWLGAFFHSVSARTAGFSTYPIGNFSNAGIIIMCFLMFIGASPGSTGGGIKTSTFFAIFQGIKSAATNKSEKAFRYSLPKDAFRKAAVITLLALSVVFVGTLLICIMEPDLPLSDVLFETVSAFATVGLSTGITPTLSIGSKILSIIIMYIGRLGPLTVATLWYFSRGEHIRYPEGNISIG